MVSFGSIAESDNLIEITVSEAIDETEYLLATQANRDSLELSMKQAAQGDVTEFTLEEAIRNGFYYKKNLWYDSEGKYIGRLWNVNGKQIYYGIYDNVHEAGKIAKQIRDKLHKEFANHE